MKRTLPISILIIFFMSPCSQAQTGTYTVTKVPFSSDKYDEFSPVYYKNGIVFCTNRNNGFASYSTSGDKGLFKINYIDTTGRVNWQNPRLFSKNLSTRLNDGPVTFNSSDDTIYFTRNLDVSGSFRDISGNRNKLGLFSAVMVDGEWTKIRELRVNNEWYNVTTPWLSPDGKKLYFASDKPGGYGGSDLYFCQWKGEYWSDPLNMGPVINTAGNEAYPFINPAGDLFFASDGHPGLGGKDIFFSSFADSAWLQPVGLDSPINSQYDDFGIIADSTMNSGYFSSAREKSIDIFFFRTIIPQIFYSDLQRENQYCFKLTDEGNIQIDNNLFRYEWDFGDGSKASGQNTEHCFPGPGIYTLKLNIIDRNTGRVFFTKLLYNLELKDVEQPYISSPYSAVVNEPLDLDGLKSNLPGYEILSYTWSFSNGERATGVNVKHIFIENGVKEVKLGLTVRELKTAISCQKSVTKNIPVFNTRQEAASYEAKLNEPVAKVNITDYDHAFIKVLYPAESDVSQDAEFMVELMTSNTRLPINSSNFKKIPPKYTVKEVFLPEENIYSYMVDREMDLISTIPVYNDLISLGFINTRIRTYILKDSAEKEVHNLKKIFGLSTDTYFNDNNRLTSSAYIVLDQIVSILNKYPEVKLEIEVHTDNTGLPQNNLTVSQGRADMLINYLVNKGIDAKRLIAKGKGGQKPIASNYTEAGKKMNRRIDFTVIKE
jgi:outer membrane protein OmpA-like peptidoglycan-associated protein